MELTGKVILEGSRWGNSGGKKDYNCFSLQIYGFLPPRVDGTFIVEEKIARGFYLYEKLGCVC